jgi:hypothetical protein
MPCDTVSTAKVKLSADTDRQLLDAAMKSLGVRSYYLDNNGNLTVNDRVTSAEFAAQVNKAYAGQVVRAKAKQFGWSVKENQDGTLQVTKAAMANKF